MRPCPHARSSTSRPGLEPEQPPDQVGVLVALIGREPPLVEVEVVVVEDGLEVERGFVHRASLDGGGFESKADG